MTEKISGGTLLRTILLIVSLINLLLVIFGRKVLPFTNDDIYQWFTAIFTIYISIRTWWKNNSFTYEAIKADALLNTLKKAQDGSDLVKLELENDKMGK